MPSGPEDGASMETTNGRPTSGSERNLLYHLIRVMLIAPISRFADPIQEGFIMLRPAICIAALSLVLPLATGCESQSSNRRIAGTWEGRGDESERPFTFGSVTFANDGTYTAEAKYGDKTRVQTGRYVVTDDGLVLDGTRTYDLDFTDESVRFTDPTTGNAMMLDRFR